jgi:hypothetical protein
LNRVHFLQLSRGVEFGWSGSALTGYAFAANIESFLNYGGAAIDQCACETTCQAELFPLFVSAHPAGRASLARLSYQGHDLQPLQLKCNVEGGGELARFPYWEQKDKFYLWFFVVKNGVAHASRNHTCGFLAGSPWYLLRWACLEICSPSLTYNP